MTIRRALVAALILALIQALAVPALARACSICHCGDPSYRLAGLDLFGRQSLRFGVSLDHYAKDQPGEDDPALRERETEMRATLSSAWTPTERLRLSADLPVAFRTIAEGRASASLAGLGDPELSAHVQVTPGQAALEPGWAAVMLGVRLPWGQNDRARNGLRADEHLQPGTGAAALLTGVSGALRLSDPLHLYASATARVNGVNRHGYRYGDALLASLALQRDLGARVALIAGLDARNARADEAGGIRVADTGGAVLYASPQVVWRMVAPFSVRLGLQIPFADRLLGGQSERVNVITGFTARF